MRDGVDQARGDRQFVLDRHSKNSDVKAAQQSFHELPIQAHEAKHGCHTRLGGQRTLREQDIRDQ